MKPDDSTAGVFWEVGSVETGVTASTWPGVIVEGVSCAGCELGATVVKLRNALSCGRMFHQELPELTLFRYILVVLGIYSC